MNTARHIGRSDSGVTQRSQQEEFFTFVPVARRILGSTSRARKRRAGQGGKNDDHR
jgi:hypothetical protein